MKNEFSTKPALITENWPRELDKDYYDQKALGRYGKSGYIYNVHSARNPDTGETSPDTLGIIKELK